MTSLAQEGAALLGNALSRTVPLHGGDLSELVRISLTDGREAIVKTGPAPKIEAAMLEAIAATGAPAPAVLAVSGTALVMEIRPADGLLSAAWESLGKTLATLHAARGPSYGWREDYAFGPVSIRNGWMESWPDFWGQRRLLVHCADISLALSRRIEALARDLANRLPEKPPVALLHGDLWGGNILVSKSEVSGLIDPACYYGHNEVDLAMLSLFDRPSAAFYRSYGKPEPGYNERVIIYKLWPALVHLRLFGSGYEPLVHRLLTEAGA